MKRLKLNNNVLLIGFFVFLSYISVILLINTHILFGGADLLFHLKRILELKSSIYHGIIFPRFSFNQFHGSAVMTLYPYINLLPIVLLSIFIKSKILLVYLWIMLNIFLSLILCFYCSKPVSNSNLISLVFSIIYSSSSMFFSYAFFDADFGVITALAILPLVIFGTLNLINKDSWIELSIGLILIIFSHVLSVFIICSFVIVSILLNYRHINLKLIKSIIKMILMVTCITSIFWIPFVYLFICNMGNITPVGFPYLQGTSYNTLFKNSIGITYGLSVFPLFSVILSIVLYKKLDKILKQMFIISIIYIFICSTLFPWNIDHISIFKIVKIFQFSWRFYIIPQILLCYILSVIIVTFIKYKKLRYVMMLFIALGAIIIQLINQKEFINYNTNSPILTKKYIHNNYHNTIFHLQYLHGITRPKYIIDNNLQFKDLYKLDGNGGPYFQDYYPKQSIQKVVNVNQDKAFYNNKNTISLYKDGYNTFAFRTNKYLNTLSLPLFKYNGEHLKVYVNNHVIHSHIKHNLIVINRVRRGKNKIRIKYIPNYILVSFELILFLVGIIYLIKICL